MFRTTFLVLTALLMNVRANAKDVRPPSSPPPWYGMATVGDDGAISIQRTVVKFVPVEEVRNVPVILTKLGNGEAVQHKETRERRFIVTKPVAESRFKNYKKEDFRITKGGRAASLAENSGLFREPVPVLVVEYHGKALDPFYAQFVSDDAYVVYVREGTPKADGSPIHIVEASRDADLDQLQEVGVFEELHLLGNEITNEGLRHIDTLDQLKRLHISSRSVTDEGLKSLANMKRLEVLNLSGMDVSDEAVAELKKSLPKCRIQR